MSTVNEAAPVPAGGIRAILADVINRAGGVKGILAQVAVAAGTAHLQNAAMEAADQLRELRAETERIALERRRELSRWESDSDRRRELARNDIAAGVHDDFVLDRVHDLERQLRYGDAPVYASRIIQGYRHGLAAMDAPPVVDDPVVVADVVDDVEVDDGLKTALAVVRDE